jgi:hypothetical protein
MDYGFNSLNKNLNSRQSNNTNLFNNLENKDIIISVRIKSIVLNEAHPRFKELGEWNALGAVEYEIVNSPTSPGSFYPIAYPLNSNSKVFPLINEIVYVISLPSTDIGASNTKVKEYYLNTISLWNHPHHNGYPINSSKPPSEQRKDYTQTQAGSVRRVTDQSTEIFLGKLSKKDQIYIHCYLLKEMLFKKVDGVIQYVLEVQLKILQITGQVPVIAETH